jgi:hypothetical protein
MLVLHLEPFANEMKWWKLQWAWRFSEDLAILSYIGQKDPSWTHQIA